MDLDSTLAEAAPARHADLAGPDSPAAAELYQRITAQPPDRRALRRPRFAASALIGLATAGAATAIALTLVPAGTGTAPVHARLAAWSVAKQPGGLVLITIRELRDPVGLWRMLRADGVRANVRFLPKYFEPTTSASAIPAGCRAPHLTDRASAHLQGRIMPPWIPMPVTRPVRSHASGRSASSGFGKNWRPGVVLAVRPSAIPHGMGLYLEAWAASPGTKSGPTLSMQTGLVQASPRCTGR